MQAPESSGEAAGRVLIVDDDGANREALRRLLAAEYHVEVTDSAIDALARVRVGRDYDVILSDVVMPDMSGLDLHGALAADAPGMEARVVFMTRGAPGTLERALRALPNIVLTKPLEVEALLALVEARTRAPQSASPPVTRQTWKRFLRS